MKKILFKGKRFDTKEWIEGYYLGFGSSIATTTIDGKIISEFGSSVNFFNVIPETVSQFTGLTDKNETKIFFDVDIIEVKNYEYDEKYGNDGFYTRHCDLRFILKQGLFNTEYEIINKPDGLNVIALEVLFNPINKSGKRIYVDNYRNNIEVIGNIFDNPELLCK